MMKGYALPEGARVVVDVVVLPTDSCTEAKKKKKRKTRQQYEC